MTKEQITLTEALDLVSFQLIAGKWQVKHVKGNVCGHVCGDVWGSVFGSVLGDVLTNILGRVFGTINGKHWGYVKTSQEDN